MRRNYMCVGYAAGVAGDDANVGFAAALFDLPLGGVPVAPDSQDDFFCTPVSGALQADEVETALNVVSSFQGEIVLNRV